MHSVNCMKMQTEKEREMRVIYRIGSLKLIEFVDEPVDERALFRASTLRFMDTIEDPTLILVETNFLHS